MATAQVPFGLWEDVALVTVRAIRSDFQILLLGSEIAKLLGMTLDGDPVVKRYPRKDGKGGEGIQVYWAWVESYMVIGTWPEHRLIRFCVSSCKEYTLKTLIDFLELAVGPVVNCNFVRM